MIMDGTTCRANVADFDDTHSELDSKSDSQIDVVGIFGLFFPLVSQN